MNLGARRSRVLGVIWILAGLGLLGGAVVLWFDRRTVSVWEVPLALVAIVIGLYLWSQRVTVDRHGITLSSMMGSQRILWAGIASVDMQATWWRPSMTIHRKGDGQTTPIRTTSGLTAGQREVLYDLLLELAREHGFEVSRPGMPEGGAVMPAAAAAAAAGFETSPGADASAGAEAPGDEDEAGSDPADHPADQVMADEAGDDDAVAAQVATDEEATDKEVTDEEVTGEEVTHDATDGESPSEVVIDEDVTEGESPSDVVIDEDVVEADEASDDVGDLDTVDDNGSEEVVSDEAGNGESVTDEDESDEVASDEVGTDGEDVTDPHMVEEDEV
ncbi:MAG TPA: hypothetical protein VJ978_14305, partial [Nitriliruptoraceae bacterium]|nr:hypothetical protein [Nitriliruptoraceae bacterium]